MTPSAQQSRETLTDVMRRRTAFIITPIVAFLDRAGFTPNTLTLLNLVVHVGFAAMIVAGWLQWSAVAIFLLGPLDVLDGALSRRQGRVQGGFGAFLDSSVDRVAELVLFGGLLIYFGQQSALLWQGVAYAAIGGSLMVSYARGRAESLGYSCKVGWFTRVERYGVICLGLLLGQPEAMVAVLSVGTWGTVVQRGIHVWRQARTAANLRNLP